MWPTTRNNNEDGSLIQRSNNDDNNNIVVVVVIVAVVIVVGAKLRESSRFLEDCLLLRGWRTVPSANVILRKTCTGSPGY